MRLKSIPNETSARVTAAIVVLGGCQLDRDPPMNESPNKVSYAVDGASIVVEEGLSFAVIDKTKQLMGPNTNLYFEAGTRSLVPTSILGDKLRVNIPFNLKEGVHPVRYKGMPGKDDVWVSYSHSPADRWTAYDGLLAIQETGGIGGRLRATFDRLQLGNPCGENRLLENGVIDVKIGSEDVFPISEIDTDVGSQWEQLHGNLHIENNMLLELDGTRFACDWASFAPKILSPEESHTGQSESVLYLLAICGCGYEPTQGSYRSLFSFVAYLPSEGQGFVLAENAPYFANILVDVNGTPDIVSDDETWWASDPPKLYYHQMSRQLNEPIDIELVNRIEFVYYETIGGEPTADYSRTMTLSNAHAYGLTNIEE